MGDVNSPLVALVARMTLSRPVTTTNIVHVTSSIDFSLVLLKQTHLRPGVEFHNTFTLHDEKELLLIYYQPHHHNSFNVT